MDEQRTDGTNDAEARAEFTRVVEVNTFTLSQLIHEFRSLRESLTAFSGGLPNGDVSARPSRRDDPSHPEDDPSHPDDLAEAERRLAEATEENLELRSRLDQTQADLQELRDQNEDLASRVANSQVRASIATKDSGAADALSWEQRKELILRQMEEESFDADAFVDAIGADAIASTGEDPDNAGHDQAGQAPPDPIESVRGLFQKLDRHESELKRRDQEIGELRCLLEQRSENRHGGDGVTFGAAAIAEMIDGDEMVREEREKLQKLQEEWEEKFRKGEVAASLERAKLSRERQELASKKMELEDQLEQIRRVSQELDTGERPPSRRWLAALGIRDSVD